MVQLNKGGASQLPKLQTHKILFFDLSYYCVTICFCLVHVYFSCYFGSCAQLPAVILCLGVLSVIEGWDGDEFLPTYHRRSQ